MTGGNMEYRSVHDRIQADRENTRNLRTLQAEQDATAESRQAKLGKNLAAVKYEGVPQPQDAAPKHVPEFYRDMVSQKEGWVTPLPSDPQARKDIPLASGVLDYFPAALAEIAKVSKAGNDQHNPGEKLHWARAKSTDQADTLLRHLTERGTLDTDGMRHSAKMAWRALALLQLELEEAGAPMARGAK